MIDQFPLWTAISIVSILIGIFAGMWWKVATMPKYIHGIKDMALYAGVTESRIESWIKEGMTAEKIHDTIWRTTDKDLAEWPALSRKEKREIRRVVKEVLKKPPIEMPDNLISMG